MAGDWTDEENDAIVADYFAMLADDITGRPYNKAEHNRLLQAMIGRPRGSIEYKHQNISAVLKGLGEDWIPGYKPAFNFQASLVDAVVRWLEHHPDWLAPAAAASERRAISAPGGGDAVDRPASDAQQRAAAGRARADDGDRPEVRCGRARRSQPRTRPRRRGARAGP